MFDIILSSHYLEVLLVDGIVCFLPPESSTSDHFENWTMVGK